MLDVEKIKKGLDICALRSAGDCTSCPYFENTYCNDLLASDAAEYIESLEERIAIMQESMETLEKRCNTLNALDQRCKTLEVLVKRYEPVTPVREVGSYSQYFRCKKCDTLLVVQKQKYCFECGQAVKWE